MLSNYAVTVSKVDCIDLLNSNWEEIQSYFLISNSTKSIRNYLESSHKSLHKDLLNEEYPHLVYIEDNYIIGTKRHNQNYTFFQLGGYEILTKNYNSKIINETFFEIVELSLVGINCLELPAKILDCYNIAFNKSNNIKRYEANFITAHLQVSNILAISLKQIKNRFNVDFHFFDTIDTSKLILKEIYYKERFPIIFVFIDTENIEFMAWNKEYLIVLQNSITNKYISIDKSSIVNKILDKVNLVGLINLKEEELAFLNLYSKLL